MPSALLSFVSPSLFSSPPSSQPLTTTHVQTMRLTTLHSFFLVCYQQTNTLQTNRVLSLESKPGSLCGQQFTIAHIPTLLSPFSFTLNTYHTDDPQPFLCSLPVPISSTINSYRCPYSPSSHFASFSSLYSFTNHSLVSS